MVEASLGDRGRVAAGNATGLPAQAPAGRLHQCIASTPCTAVLSWAVELSESSGSSSALKQHCVWIATVPMSFVLLSEPRLERLDSRQQRARALPQNHCHAVVGQRVQRFCCSWRYFSLDCVGNIRVCDAGPKSRLHALRDKPDASRALSEIVAAVDDGRNLSQHVKALILRQVSHVVLQSCVGWDHRPRPKRPLICRRDSGAFASSSGSQASPEVGKS